MPTRQWLTELPAVPLLLAMAMPLWADKADVELESKKQARVAALHFMSEY